MQKPVGAVMRNGRAEMIDFGALVGNSYGWLTFGHTLVAGFVCGGFFVMGVSAWHLIRKSETDFFGRSFRTAAVFALAASVLVAVLGDQQGVNVAKTQPAKNQTGLCLIPDDRKVLGWIAGKDQFAGREVTVDSKLDHSG
jgi:cytochrome d ubiquinol oxidase subunit I